MDFDLTEEEKKAIRALKRVAKIWPDSLWLFSGAGTLCVMRKGENNDRVILSGTFQGGFDSDYVIATIDIDNDGGDW